MTAPEPHRHMIAHTARMLMVLDARPDHPRASEYTRQLRIYRGRWAELSAAEQSAAQHSMLNAPDVPDLTPSDITSAIQELER